MHFHLVLSGWLKAVHFIAGDKWSAWSYWTKSACEGGCTGLILYNCYTMFIVLLLYLCCNSVLIVLHLLLKPNFEYFFGTYFLRSLLLLSLVRICFSFCPSFYLVSFLKFWPSFHPVNKLWRYCNIVSLAFMGLIWILLVLATHYLSLNLVVSSWNDD